MLFRTMLAGLAACFALVTGAMAQNADIAGQWQCEFSRMPYSQNDPSGQFVRIIANLAPGGAFYAEGSNYSPWNGAETPVQAQGQWSIDTQSRGTPYVVIQAQYAGYQGMIVPLVFFARIIDGRNMVLQERDQTHETAVTCRR